MMEINVNMRHSTPPDGTGGIRAFADITIDNSIKICGLKVMESGKGGLFVAMPNRKTDKGYVDICYPITKEFREALHEKVMGSYEAAIGQEVASQGSKGTALREAEETTQEMQIGGIS